MNVVKVLKYVRNDYIQGKKFETNNMKLVGWKIFIPDQYLGIGPISIEKYVSI